MKVKILITSYESDYNDDSYHISHGICDWEEITDEEYNFLKDNLYKIDFGGRPILLTQDNIPVRDRIISIKAFLEKKILEAQEEQRRKEEDKVKKEQKSLLKKQKQFEKLKKELGVK